MTKTIAIPAIIALAIVGIVATMRSEPAQALPPVSLLQQMPAVGPAFVDSFKVTCGTTATNIAPAAGTSLAIQCFAPESTDTGAASLVAIGDAGVASPAFATRNSPVMCGTGCNQTTLPANAKNAYCRVASGTVDIFCWSLVSQLPP